MKQRITILFALLNLFNGLTSIAQSPEEMILTFVNAWRGNEEIKIEKATRIGIDLTDGEDFTVSFDPSGKAKLEKGLVPGYYFHYAMSKQILTKIYNREYNALTAMGAAKSTDVTPLDVGFPEGASPDENFLPFFLSFSFHFWNRDWPEKVLYGESNSRMVHGGLATVFYYQPGLRTAWYKLKPGMHANREDDDQKNLFPSIFIVTKGKGHAKLGDKKVILKEGEMYFIPANMSHEFWSDKDEMECIMIAFGEGA